MRHEGVAKRHVPLGEVSLIISQRKDKFENRVVQIKALNEIIYILIACEPKSIFFF